MTALKGENCHCAEKHVHFRSIALSAKEDVLIVRDKSPKKKLPSGSSFALLNITLLFIQLSSHVNTIVGIGFDDFILCALLLSLGSNFRFCAIER